MNRFTQADLERLKRENKIRGFNIPKRKPRKDDPKGRIVAKHFPKRSKEKDWVGWNLLYWTNANAVQLQEEYKFHQGRNWRFDWAIPSLKVAIEYEGGIFNPNGDHRSVKGIDRDTEKYNAAAAQGWRLIRLTALNYKTLHSLLNQYKPPTK